jgi:delta 1-pyrroline-5-carboxylate dehydrogenase
VQDAVFDEFLGRFCESGQRLVVADGFTEGVNVGPLIDGPALEKVERHVADALEQGAALLLGGSGHERGGQFFQPTVLDGITDTMLMANEETFGPVAGISRFATEEEAVRRANDTPYGLSSYFYSRDMARIWRVSEALEHGILGINTGVISTEVAPFGGVKESGIGREGSHYEIDEWLEVSTYAWEACEQVIVEERTYHVHTGKLAEVVRLYADEGTAIQQRILGHLIGAFTVDIGDLSSIVQLWGYDSFAERERRRGELQADPGWKDLLTRLTPMLHTQRSRILIPTSFSPIQ